MCSSIKKRKKKPFMLLLSLLCYSCSNKCFLHGYFPVYPILLPQAEDDSILLPTPLVGWFLPQRALDQVSLPR